MEFSDGNNDKLDTRVPKLLEQLNSYSEKINMLTNKRSAIRNDYIDRLLSLRFQKSLFHKLYAKSIKKSMPYFKEFWKLNSTLSEVKVAEQYYLTSSAEVQLAMKLVNNAENLYCTIGHDEGVHRTLLIDLIEQFSEKYFICLRNQHQAYGNYRQVQNKFARQEQLVRNLHCKFGKHIQKSKLYYEMEDKEKRFLHQLDLKLQIIESEIDNCRYQYRQTMRTLENVSNEIHQFKASQNDTRTQRFIMLTVVVRLVNIQLIMLNFKSNLLYLIFLSLTISSTK